VASVQTANNKPIVTTSDFGSATLAVVAAGRLIESYLRLATGVHDHGVLIGSERTHPARRLPRSCKLSYSGLRGKDSDGKFEDASAVWKQVRMRGAGELGGSRKKFPARA
jgi:hypothetical protein